MIFVQGPLFVRQTHRLLQSGRTISADWKMAEMATPTTNTKVMDQWTVLWLKVSNYLSATCLLSLKWT